MSIELVGTPKQVAWATEIRAKWNAQKYPATMAALEKKRRDAGDIESADRCALYVQVFNKFLEFMNAHSDARFWIESRGYWNGEFLMERLIQKQCGVMGDDGKYRRRADGTWGPTFCVVMPENEWENFCAKNAMK